MGRGRKSDIETLTLEPRWAYVRDIIYVNDLYLYEFADIIGTSTQQLSGWLTGRFEPSLFSFTCLCVALQRVTGVPKEEHALMILWGE